ncbi:MAG: class I adenylate-forming enzyme family protein [Alphaproteobacteria bacterium]
MTEMLRWPARSIEETHAILTAPGSTYEMDTAVIRGVETRVWKNAPPNLRTLLELGRVWGDREFVVYQDERMTFEQHHRAVVKLANALWNDYGVRKGDRVVIAMRNYPEWILSWAAVTAIGAVAVPLNSWGTGEELEYGVTDSESRVAIADQERYDRLRPHLPRTPLKSVILARGDEDVPNVDAFESVVAHPSRYDDLPADAALPEVEVEPEDYAFIFYTSGTTGKPKGALGTHRNVLTNLLSSFFTRARAFVRRGEEPPTIDPNAPQRAGLLSVPLFHATGCFSVLVPSFALGGKLVLMYRWDPEQALELIERERINSFGGVPAMVWQVLESPNFGKYDLSSVENVGYGGAPAAPELVARIKEAFPEIESNNGYGLTETSAITTMNFAEDYAAKPDSVGVPVPVCDVKIVDAEGNALPQGEVGEIWIKGPNVVAGYWRKPEATAQSFTDGWLHSGDLGRMDEEGFLYILDRAKDMLIRGGENIYCVQVEDVLYSHPAVMDAAVVGIPHKVLGEEVGAIVQVKPGHDVTESELQAHVAQHLAAFKVPVTIEIRREPLPRNANGKILKRDLREEFLEHIGRKD